MSGNFKVDPELKQVEQREVCVLHLAGSVDASAVAEFEAAFGAAFTAGQRHIVLDFERVEYLSSAGLRLLLKFRKTVLDGSGAIKIAALHREIRENVFDALGFSRLLEVHGTVQEAIESFEE